MDPSQITESNQTHQQDILDENLPPLSDSPEAKPSAEPCTKYVTCGNVLFFLPNVIELGVIGYGIGIYYSGDMAQGLTFIGVFSGIFIATVIAQCCMCKRGGFSFKPDSPSSSLEESDNIDTTATVERQSAINTKQS